MSDFVHLHVHSDYSLLDGCMKTEDIISKCKKEKWDTISITNHGNLFNVLDIVDKGREQGIKVIPGMESYMTWDFPCTSKGAEFDQRFHIIFLAQNETGYKNLLKLSTESYTKGFYHKPRVDFDLLSKYNEGIIMTTSCRAGKICQTLLDHREQPELRDKELGKALGHYKDIFGDRVYLEIQSDPEDESFKYCADQIIDLGKRTDTKIIATGDSHYLHKEHHPAWQTMMKLASNGKFGGDLKNNYWLKSRRELEESLPGFALDETVNVGRRCEQIVVPRKYRFPHIDTKGKTPDDALYENTMVGLATRLTSSMVPWQLHESYFTRAKFELDVLKKMGFSSYILIVADYVNWAKQMGIYVGPARGSAAGSIACWATGITDVDSIKYGLLFERFINPERVSLPDIDVDFEDVRRDMIKQYLAEKYGHDHVASITTFGTMAAKGALRDVARMQGLTYSQGDTLAKAVPDGKRGKNVYLEEAMEDKSFADLIKGNEHYQKTYEISTVIEGMVRNTGTHAAGVVISDDKPLVEYTPLYKDKEGNIVTQYDMNVLEKIGLIKLDLLGLATLTTIKRAIDFIEVGHKQKVVLDKIPLDDKKTYEILQSGDLEGIFQLCGSEGFKELTMKVKPQTVEEIADITSLYRPGPLDNDFDKAYIKNKHSKDYDPQVVVSVKKEDVDRILRPTKGVIIYQEQVMELARVLAGYSLGEADLLRRVMGKKKPEEMEKMKKGFIEGCAKNEVPANEAEHVFDVLAKFAEYGFNKSHAIAYSLITYYTAWLKAYYPVEFLAASLTEELGKTENVLALINNCRDRGIKILPPDINKSQFGFSPEGKAIRCGMGCIKGLGETVVDEILEKRTKYTQFVSLFDFCNKVHLQRVNRKSLDALIKSGSFDSIL